MFNIMNKWKLYWKKKYHGPLVYDTVGDAIDDNPTCVTVVIATLYEEDIYLGLISKMPYSLRNRRVIRTSLDDKNLILLT